MSHLIKNLYIRLGLNRTATQSEIKTAYYNLSKDCHPDRNNGCDKLTQKFRDITEAYEILGNETSRHDYDRSSPNDGRTAPSNPRRTENQRYAYEYSKRDQDFEEMLKTYRQQMRQSPRRPADSYRQRVFNFNAWYNAHYKDFIHSEHAWDHRRVKREEYFYENIDSESNDRPEWNRRKWYENYNVNEENIRPPKNENANEFDFKHIYTDPNEYTKARERREKRNKILNLIAISFLLFIPVQISVHLIEQSNLDTDKIIVKNKDR